LNNTSGGDQYLDSLGLVCLCYSRLPEDGTAMPKHVGVDTREEFGFIIVLYCILVSAFIG